MRDVNRQRSPEATPNRRAQRVGMWLYTGLGCARSPKKMLADRRIVDRSKLEDDVAASSHSEVGGNIGEFPLPNHEEVKLSAAPTREASFVQGGLGRRRLADSSVFEAVNVNVPCHSCGTLITGALYMGYDRAYCSAAACDKVIGSQCQPDWDLWRDCLGKFATAPTFYSCHPQAKHTERGPSRLCYKLVDESSRGRARPSKRFGGALHVLCFGTLRRPARVPSRGRAGILFIICRNKG